MQPMNVTDTNLQYFFNVVPGGKNTFNNDTSKAVRIKLRPNSLYTATFHGAAFLCIRAWASTDYVIVQSLKQNGTSLDLASHWLRLF